VVFPTPSTPSMPTRTGCGQVTATILSASISINVERFIVRVFAAARAHPIEPIVLHIGKHKILITSRFPLPGVHYS
jgi:hypothetical protein